MRWTLVSQMNDSDCGLKGMRWNMNNQVDILQIT